MAFTWLCLLISWTFSVPYMDLLSHWQWGKSHFGLMYFFYSYRVFASHQLAKFWLWNGMLGWPLSYIFYKSAKPLTTNYILDWHCLTPYSHGLTPVYTLQSWADTCLTSYNHGPTPVLHLTSIGRHLSYILHQLANTCLTSYINRPSLWPRNLFCTFAAIWYYVANPRRKKI